LNNRKAAAGVSGEQKRGDGFRLFFYASLDSAPSRHVDAVPRGHSVRLYKQPARETPAIPR
jgi:hypothetical protein